MEIMNRVEALGTCIYDTGRLVGKNKHFTILLYRLLFLTCVKCGAGQKENPIRHGYEAASDGA